MRFKYQKTVKSYFHRWFAWRPVKVDIIKQKADAGKDKMIFTGAWVWLEIVERRLAVGEGGKRRYEYRTIKEIAHEDAK